MTSPILLLCFSGALWICFGASQGASIEASKIQPGEPASYEEGSCQDDLECEEAEVCLEGVCTLQNVDLVQDSPLATHDSQAEKSRLAKESFIEELKEDHESVEEDYEASEEEETQTVLNNQSAKGRKRSTSRPKTSTEPNYDEGLELIETQVSQEVPNPVPETAPKGNNSQVVIGDEEAKDADLITNAKLIDEQAKTQSNPADREHLLGSYKFPDTCNHQRLGSCQLVIKWSKTLIPDEIRFEVQTKNKKWSAIGFSNSTKLIGADVVTITRKGSIIDRYVNDQRSVSKDTSNNLIDPDVEFKQDTLIGKFTRRLKNDDVEHDIDLSNPEGIIMFVPGGEVGSDKSYSILPEKINLGQHFAQEEEDEDIPTDESSSTKRDIINFSYEDPPDVDVTTHPSLIETMETLEDPTDNPTAITMDVDVKYIRERDEERHEIQGQEAIASTIQPVPLKNKILPELIPDSEACQEANIGKKLGLSGTPTRYQFCNHNGDPDVGQCPSGSLFYSQLHCCVSTLKFPCLKNCLADI